MHEVVRRIFHSKPVLSKRLPSFAGKGLPERMRSTAFAFLGLTAAAGLGLVAIFAQLGFPLLSPVPLPSDPSRANAVAEAKPIELDPSSPRAVAVEPARNAVSAPQLRGSGNAADQQEPRGGEAGVDDPSAPVSTPASESEPGGAEPADTPAPAPESPPVPSPVPTSSAPEPAPEPEAAPAAPPAPEAKPASTKPPKPEAKPANSKPSKPAAKPANSKPAAPEAKPVKTKPEAPEAKPAPAPTYEAAPPPVPVEKEKNEKSKGKK